MLSRVYEDPLGEDGNGELVDKGKRRISWDLAREG